MIELSRWSFAVLSIFAALGVLVCINIAREFYALRHDLARYFESLSRTASTQPLTSIADVIDAAESHVGEMDARVGDWTVCMIDDRKRKMLLPQLVETLTKYPERVAWVESPAIGEETEEVQS